MLIELQSPMVPSSGCLLYADNSKVRVGSVTGRLARYASAYVLASDHIEQCMVRYGLRKTLACWVIAKDIQTAQSEPIRRFCSPNRFRIIPAQPMLWFTSQRCLYIKNWVGAW